MLNLKHIQIVFYAFHDFPLCRLSGSYSFMDSRLQCTDTYVNQESYNMPFNEIDWYDEDQYSDDDGDHIDFLSSL